MIQRKKKIVLYQPKQVDETLGRESSKDLLPLEMLSIAGYPLENGYEVVIVDGSLYHGEEGHRRLLEECSEAMLVGTTGILGYMVTDGWLAISKVKARHPDLPAVIGGWFASVRPDLMLETGLYEAVVHGQGEHAFWEVVQAIDAGEPLDSIEGLSLLRDGQVVRTEPRKIVGWDDLLPMPWQLIDIEPYRQHQLRRASAHDILRMPTPPSIGWGNPYFGVVHVSSFGCPEPCPFCCAPEVAQRRWKAMPAERMVDEIAEMHDRWGFDVLRFHDANIGVHHKRMREFAEKLIEREVRIQWNAFIEVNSILKYDSSTLDLLAESGMYVAEIGTEAADAGMLKRIGKPIRGEENIEAAVEMDKRGIQANCTYIIGFPGESEESMMATIDQCRRLHNAARHARPTTWPFRPIPGTPMWDEAVELGYQGPQTIPEWGSIGEYHMTETWPGNIPSKVERARRMYQHFVTLSYGNVRGKVGWWERRAQRRLEDGSYRNARWEARAFHLYHRLTEKLSRSKKNGTDVTAAEESVPSRSDT